MMKPFHLISAYLETVVRYRIQRYIIYCADNTYYHVYIHIRFVDDVVKTIKQKLSGGNDSVSLSVNTPKILDIGNDVKSSWLRNQPHDTVLVFNGAITNTMADQTYIEQKLVVFCDGCKEEIKDDIYCCKTCFDYDLCKNCYPKLSKTHGDGNHEFVIENDA